VAIEGIGPVSYSGMPREMRVNGLKPVSGKVCVLYRVMSGKACKLYRCHVRSCWTRVRNKYGWTILEGKVAP
jgi:hypothetical protein